ncbi:fatty acid desaturase family protein [Ralstonia solanacearum]|uniref:fatty acid desaturase family protein n=1 Tax=Ralstonia solanacearum TaxID=305 RepID=UPI001E2BE45D|nr:fatty acid desaturase [Ralstonia solanacearum]
MSTRAPTAALGRVRYGWLADVPSVLFLAGVVANTSLIAWVDTPWLLVLLTLPQALLLGGCQEAKHVCVHGTFLRHRGLNDAVGTVCAALFGVNFVAYRALHYQHHRATCTEADPEGGLYELSWRTRWIWLLAPIELPWVAFHINRIGWPMVPPGQRRRRAAALAWMVMFAVLVGIAARHAPQTVLFGYAVPLALFSWFDFVLTQAEHYQIDIVPAAPEAAARPPGPLTLDIVLPLGLGWLTLHRPLHRVHHCHPGLRWYEAPRRLRADPTATPMPYAAFVRRWLAAGPRLWLRADGSPAAPYSTDRHDHDHDA